ncbi:MAG: class I adenylate-forming enzyme family protein [Pseudomonadota bacterium]|nr:class I adenylate-forming enzyme family protein [Pseudomonadota bacterium]
MANLATLLNHQALRKPDHTAIIEGERKVDYRTLADRVCKWASYLSFKFGLGVGDVIAVGLRNTADHVIMNWAVVRLGAIILPIDHRWTDTEKRDVIEGFGASAYVTESGEALAVPVALNTEFREQADAHPTAEKFPEDEDLPMVLSLSSGTTGSPKGPAVTHRQMRARWVTQLVSLGFTERDRYLSATPLYFGGGRSFTMSATWLGATVIMFPPPFAPEELVSAAAGFEATITLLVPTMLRRLLALEGHVSPPFSGLKSLLSTGALLHENERQSIMEQLCPNFINYYGSTEGGGISILSTEHGDKGSGSVGQVVFGTQVEIVDWAHRPVPSGETGQIRYRGEGVASGFYKNAEADRAAYRDGWFYPGDAGMFDQDGFLHLSGRTKDVIIRGGVNIYPSEVEGPLLSCKGVTDAAVIGIPSHEFGQEIVAFVVGSPDEGALRRHLSKHIAGYKMPKSFFSVLDLPKSDLGKINRKELKKRVLKNL